MTISEKAIEARVRRALARDGELLRKTRPGRTWTKATFGNYFTVDSRTGIPRRRHCELEQLARECDAVQPWESLAG